MAKQYDAIVVGAGLAGSGTAALLAKAGKKVLLLERSKLIGGRASSFKYKGYTLNVGEHAGLVGGYIDQLVEACGTKPPERGIFDEMMMYRNKKLMNLFDIAPLLDLEESQRVFKVFQDIPEEELSKYDDMSAKQWLDDNGVKGEWNRWLLEWAGIIFNTIPTMEDMAASSLIEAAQTTVKNLQSFQAAGGIISYSQVMVDVLKEKGGDVQTRTRVTEILLDKNKVAGVRVERLEPQDETADNPLGDMETIEAPMVVTAFPIYDIFNLIPEERFPGDFVKMAKNLNLLTANLGFMAGLKEPLWTTNRFIMADFPTLGYPTTIFISSNLVPDVAPPGEALLECSCIMFHSDIGENRGKMHRKLEEMKADFDDLHPGWQDKLIWWRPYFRWEEPARTPGREGKYKPGPKAPGIEGLYFTGDTVNSHGTPGMEAASDSAMLCVKEILGKLP